jgi:hypothetical protein
MIALWVVTAVFAVALFLIAGGLVELFRTVEQLRVETGIIDSVTLIGTPSAQSVGESGLPEALVQSDRAALLVLSEMCSTCRQLATRLADQIPADMWILFESRVEDSADAWLRQNGLAGNERVITDSRGRVANALGISISPAIVRIRDGTPVAAHTIPSVRRLEDEMNWLRAGGPDRPIYAKSNGNHLSLDDSPTGRQDSTFLGAGEKHEGH